MKVILYVYDVLVQKNYELCVNTQLNFQQITKKLRENKNVVSSDLLVIEEFTKQNCNIWMSLEALHVTSGMHFYIF